MNTRSGWLLAATAAFLLAIPMASTAEAGQWTFSFGSGSSYGNHGAWRTAPDAAWDRRHHRGWYRGNDHGWRDGRGTGGWVIVPRSALEPNRRGWSYDRGGRHHHHHHHYGCGHLDHQPPRSKPGRLFGPGKVHPWR